MVIANRLKGSRMYMVYQGKLCNNPVSGLPGSPEGFSLGAIGEISCAVGKKVPEVREEPWKSPGRSTFHS